MFFLVSHVKVTESKTVQDEMVGPRQQYTVKHVKVFKVSSNPRRMGQKTGCYAASSESSWMQLVANDGFHRIILGGVRGIARYRQGILAVRYARTHISSHQMIHFTLATRICCETSANSGSYEDKSLRSGSCGQISPDDPDIGFGIVLEWKDVSKKFLKQIESFKC